MKMQRLTRCASCVNMAKAGWGVPSASETCRMPRDPRFLQKLLVYGGFQKLGAPIFKSGYNTDNGILGSVLGSPIHGKGPT